MQSVDFSLGVRLPPDDFFHFRPRARIGHVLLRQSRTAGLQDAVTEHREAVGAVGIR